jgi:hypothetical protein
MVPFAGLLAALQEIPDPRRRQGQRYSLAPLLLFSGKRSEDAMVVGA